MARIGRIFLVLFIATILAIAAQVESAEPAGNPHPTAMLYAGSLLLGSQLGARKAAREGAVAASVAKCFLALKVSSLTDTVESVLVGNLTQAELKQADAFFATSAGQKYAKLGQLGVYSSVGETPPEEPPVISEAEDRQIQDFNSSAVGTKLWKTLDGEPAHQAFGVRLHALLKSCGAA